MHQLDQLGNPRRLARLEVADEVPVERVAPPLVLRLEILEAVLPHRLDAGLGQHAELVGGHVLGRDDDLRAGADLVAHAGEVLAEPLSR